MAKITIDTDNYALIFLQKDAGDQWELYQDGKEQAGAQKVNIFAERENFTEHDVTYTTGLEKKIEDSAIESKASNIVNEHPHSVFFEELSKFDTAVLKRHKDVNQFVVFNNGKLNASVESVILEDGDGYSRILHSTVKG
ncbi:hypothetical protein [Oceanobacillus oncorhynchi]|uniref:hypothetical protein n=1 Tax=Oceanobacillus oncorhynchi TaxID=545501 RepID=UPI0034D4A5ED